MTARLPSGQPVHPHTDMTSAPGFHPRVSIRAT